MTLDELIAQLTALRDTVPGDAQVQIFSASDSDYATTTYHRDMHAQDVYVVDFRKHDFDRDDPRHGKVIVELGDSD